MTVGFIGCGNMGGVLAAVAAGRIGGENVRVADHNAEKTARLQSACGAVPSTAEEIARACDMIFLGVKPQVMRSAAAEIRDILGARESGALTVSMAAGLTAAAVSEMLGGAPVLRIMPNTAAASGEGVILYSPGEGVTEEDTAAFCELMAPAGLVARIDEAKIDAASAVTGCGPAFVYLFIEALTDGGVRCGLPRETAKRFALQTVCGAAKLGLETGRDPALLRGDVCSPAGSTIEGVAALEERAVRAAVIEAVTAAYRRTAELGK